MKKKTYEIKRMIHEQGLPNQIIKTKLGRPNYTLSNNF